jgi:predicted RNase H-like HicB family nuclease
MRKAPTGFELTIEYYREDDGRWLADIPALPGLTAYGRTRNKATAAAQALALRLIADRLEHGEAVPGSTEGPPLSCVRPIRDQDTGEKDWDGSRRCLTVVK